MGFFLKALGLRTGAMIVDVAPRFVSHWWGEPVVQFTACVEKHSHHRKLSPMVAYWVCAYANNQPLGMATFFSKIWEGPWHGCSAVSDGKQSLKFPRSFWMEKMIQVVNIYEKKSLLKGTKWWLITGFATKDSTYSSIFGLSFRNDFYHPPPQQRNNIKASLKNIGIASPWF